MSDDGEWIEGAILDDWRARDEAKNARISALEAALIAADEAALSCDEILRLLIKNIEADGHYSVESTVTFLQGARSELTAYRQARDATR